MHTTPKATCRLLPALLLMFASSAQANSFSDDFSNPQSGWPHAAASSDLHRGFSVYTDSAQYQMTPVQDDTFGFANAPQQLGSEVALGVDLFLYAGIGRGAAGLACRYRDPSNFDAALLRGDGAVLLLRVREGKAEPLASAQLDSVVAGVIDTRLELHCRGEQLRARTRDGQEIEANSPGPSEGESGLLVIGEAAAGTHALFDNFAMRALQ